MLWKEMHHFLPLCTSWEVSVNIKITRHIKTEPLADQVHEGVSHQYLSRLMQFGEIAAGDFEGCTLMICVIQ